MEAQVILPTPYGVFFDKDQGFCFLCEKALHSPQVRDQHLSGSKHTKKLFNTFGAEGGGEDSCHQNMKGCSICRVTLLGGGSVAEHLASDQHRASMNQQPVPGAGVLTQPPVLADSAGSSDPVTRAPGTPPTRVSAESTPVSQQKGTAVPAACGLVDRALARDIVTPAAAREKIQAPGSPSGQKDRDENSRSTLYPVTGLNILPSVAGEVEQVPVAQPPEPSQLPLKCNICLVSFNGQSSADEHFSSKSHGEKVELNKLMVKGTLPRDPKTGALKEASDKYICSVCLCAMNSPKSYTQHTQGSQHGKNYEELKKWLPQDPENLQFRIGLSPASELTPSNSANQISILGINNSDVSRTNVHQRSASMAIGNHGSRSAGQTVDLGGDNALNGSDDLRTLPASCPADGHQEQAGRPFEETSDDGNMLAESVCAASDAGTTSDNETAENEEFLVVQNASVASTTSDNETSHGVPWSFAVMRGDKPVLEATFTEKKQTQTSGGENEEFLVVENASVASTTSGNETSHGVPWSFAVMRGDKPVREATFTEKKTTQTSGGFSCQQCKKAMNTQKDLNIHNESLPHKTMLAMVPAPDKSEEPLVKCEDGDKIMTEIYRSSKTTPRTYQVHLLCKTMASDSAVVFLPTGTGKTLIAMMAIRRMLMRNRTRPVLFLTETGLLAVQQGENIRKELGQDSFFRPHLTEEGQMEMRPLKVAKLHGGQYVSDATPLWKYDVLVMTAGYCQNLLEKGVLRWANFSLVVVDEAHHCARDHLYKVLVDNHHLPIVPPERRPKVLGLTASPVGKPTKEDTLRMMRNLLHNLGGAAMVAVDEKSNTHAEKSAHDQLAMFTSRAKLRMEFVPLTEMEQKFQARLRAYFADAYRLLLKGSNLRDLCQKDDLRSLPPDSTEDLTKLLTLAQSDGLQLSEKFKAIHTHVSAVGQALLNSEDGIAFVLEDLEHIFDDNQNRDFHLLRSMNLPCEALSNYVKNLCDSMKFHTIEEDPTRPEAAMLHMSVFQKLLETLADPQYVNWENQASMVLVLVRERDTAFKFHHHLERSSFVRQRRIPVEVLVGHGAGSGEARGMRVRQQGQTLQHIQSADRSRTIIVATSVAEEGIDIRECQLVVSVNVPTTVKAMVQMRGRTRRKDSFFVVLCTDLKERGKMEELQLQEENMLWAVDQLLHQDSV
ncbi:uncharacterized protein LOC143301150 [Babylonia areolata]|uniref:uncharacterized protein LOC143301150 n=1 Tax=Babylonia areolata TaxID=304850 RepID=UPI003FD5C6D4